MASSTWFDASKIAIRVVEDGVMLEDPAIVCTECGAFLTILADMDTVASLMTLAAEHTCTNKSEERREISVMLHAELGYEMGTEVMTRLEEFVAQVKAMGSGPAE